MYLVTRENDYEGEELLMVHGMYDEAVEHARSVKADRANVYYVKRNCEPALRFTTTRYSTVKADGAGWWNGGRTFPSP